MPSETSFAKIKFASAGDKVQKFPAEVSKPGAETIDKYLQEHTFTWKGYAGPATLKSGEFAAQKKSGETFTLPAVTASAIIGVFCNPEATSAKVATSGGALIFGDFIEAAGTITLAKNQHVIFFSDGTNWLIIAGEPKREQAYTDVTVTKAEAEAGITPSATRPAFVALVVSGALNTALQFSANSGGKAVGAIQTAAVAAFHNEATLGPFLVQPGTTWTMNFTTVPETIKSCTVLL